MMGRTEERDRLRDMTQLLNIKTNRPVKPVELTPKAVDKISELISTEEDAADLALRMAVRPGGCSGFSYEMFFDSQRDADDIVLEFDDGVNVVVDPQSVEMIKGSTLDYKDGLMEAGFSIDNPNVTRSCGCGNSFA